MRPKIRVCVKSQNYDLVVVLQRRGHRLQEQSRFLCGPSFLARAALPASMDAKERASPQGGITERARQAAKRFLDGHNPRSLALLLAVGLITGLTPVVGLDFVLGQIFLRTLGAVDDKFTDDGEVAALNALVVFLLNFLLLPVDLLFMGPYQTPGRFGSEPAGLPPRPEGLRIPRIPLGAVLPNQLIRQRGLPNSNRGLHAAWGEVSQSGDSC
jgi:hypothetical protein